MFFLDSENELPDICLTPQQDSYATPPRFKDNDDALAKALADTPPYRDPNDENVQQEKIMSTSSKSYENPLLTCGIISQETAKVLLPPPEEILPGRKRTLRVKSCARVMTSKEVIDDLENQKTLILNKTQCKRKRGVKVTKPAKKPNRDIEKEDSNCYICGADWGKDSLRNQTKWVGCESSNCPRWTCPKCLPENFNYSAEYFCNTCNAST